MKTEHLKIIPVPEWELGRITEQQWTQNNTSVKQSIAENRKQSDTAFVIRVSRRSSQQNTPSNMLSSFFATMQKEDTNCSH